MRPCFFRELLPTVLVCELRGAFAALCQDLERFLCKSASTCAGPMPALPHHYQPSASWEAAQGDRESGVFPPSGGR